LHTDLVKDALRTEKGQAKAMEELIAKLVKLERMLYGSTPASATTCSASGNGSPS